MFFKPRHKTSYSWLQAIEEPCFVFDEKGLYEESNLQGAELLKALGYEQPVISEGQDAFIKMMFFFAPEPKSGMICLSSGTFRLGVRRFENKTLVRLIPCNEAEQLGRLLVAVDSVPWGILNVDMALESPQVVFSNQKAGDFLDIPPKNMVGVPVLDIFRISGVPDAVFPMLQSPEDIFWEGDYRSGDQNRWYRYCFTPFRYGSRDYCVVCIEDRSEGKILENQYFQSQRLESLGQLAGGVAHDFNNILSIIDGYARVTRKAAGDKEQVVNYIDKIMQSVQRGSSLTSQLLTFGRHKVVKESCVDLGQTVQDQEALLRPLMDASIYLSIKAQAHIYVDVAPDNIAQILMNLCINARDAMHDGGNVIVEVERGEDGRAVLRVIDTGIGMTPEVQARIFDPFFTTKDQGKGTGLGLSMVYGLVKDMKGEITVSSKPGHGTVMTIFLPTSQNPPQKKDVVEDENGETRLNGYTVLVAEDEPALLDLVADMLQEIGMTVLKASNGNEALLIQEDYDGDIDFLLTDVVMPELNGVKLAELFGAVRPSAKVLFMSGYPANGQMSRVPLPEGAPFMSKPINFKELGNVFKSMLIQSDQDNGEREWSKTTGQWRNA